MELTLVHHIIRVFCLDCQVPRCKEGELFNPNVLPGEITLSCNSYLESSCQIPRTDIDSFGFRGISESASAVEVQELWVRSSKTCVPRDSTHPSEYRIPKEHSPHLPWYPLCRILFQQFGEEIVEHLGSIYKKHITTLHDDKDMQESILNSAL